MVLMWVVQDKLARWRPSNLKVLTHWNGPAEVEREGMLIESMQQRIIFLLLDVFSSFSCTSLSAIQISKELRQSVILEGELDGVMSSDRVVSLTNLCSSQFALRSSIITMKERGTSLEPRDILPQSVFQEETRLPTLTRWHRWERYNANHLSRQWLVLKAKKNNCCCREG